MSEKPLSEEQIEKIRQIKKEWIAEAKLLEGLPELERKINQLDGNLDDPYKILSKKYMRQILEIKGKFPKGGDSHEQR